VVPHILNLGHRCGLEVKFTLPPLCAPERAPSIHLIGSYVELSVSLDVSENSLLHLQETKHFLRLPVRRIISIPPSYPGCLYVHVPMLIRKVEVLTA
jgi:hypothetical protein